MFDNIVSRFDRTFYRMELSMSGSSSQDGNFYSTEQTREILEIKQPRLYELRALGILPHRNITAKTYEYPRDYVDGLRSFIRVGVDHGYRPNDTVVVQLWYFYYHYHGGPPKERKRVKKLLGELLATGKAVRIDAFCNQMNGVATPDAIMRWAQDGKIIAIKIGKTSYLSREYCNYLYSFLTEWPTLSDAAIQIGIPYQTLVASYQREGFRQLTAPNGQVRLDPAQVKATAEKKAKLRTRLLTIHQAANRMGILPASIYRAIATNSIESVGSGKERRIPEDVVNYWAKRFKTLNPGFEWLQAQHRSQKKVRLLTAKVACGRLGIAESSFSLWHKENLMPFYERSFEPSGSKLFPERYVDGLVGFAKRRGVTKITRKTARQYRKLCQEWQIIV